jgi:[ribosomal protein S5]-alanine N-acetyltransferase
MERDLALNPQPVMLRSERLLLTDLTADELPHLYAMDRDPMVMRYIGDGKAETRSFEEFSAFFRERIGLWASERFHIWAMREHGRDEFLGWAMLKPIRNTPHVEVGYRMPQSSWGKGYATEATRAILDYAFNVLNLEEITAVTHPENAASQHVLTKSGLARDGTLNYNGGGEIPFFRIARDRRGVQHG